MVWRLLCYLPIICSGEGVAVVYEEPAAEHEYRLPHDEVARRVVLRDLLLGCLQHTRRESH